MPASDRHALLDPRADLSILEEVERPRTRAECVGGPRPCPWVGCQFHLYLDITHAGGLTLNFPDKDPCHLAETCALDVAEEQGATLERVGELLNVTRERIRQIEATLLKKLKKRLPDGADDFASYDYGHEAGVPAQVSRLR